MLETTHISMVILNHRWHNQRSCQKRIESKAKLHTSAHPTLRFVRPLALNTSVVVVSPSASASPLVLVMRFSLPVTPFPRSTVAIGAPLDPMLVILAIVGDSGAVFTPVRPFALAPGVRAREFLTWIRKGGMIF
jgi:hypothetical protein